MSGGDRVARVLQAHRVETLFTLCGGHIAPILVAAERRGVRIADVRDEASAVFAADATARLSGRPGVAVVTAGPGVTNTLTAVENARLAQSPVVMLGGATATLLRSRGALQDIDQRAIVTPHVKWYARSRRLAEVEPLLAHAFERAASGVPGPVFLELPVDLLYDEETVREWYQQGTAGGGPAAWLRRLYLRSHLRRLFGGATAADDVEIHSVAAPSPSIRTVDRVRRRLRRARRPLLLVGSQATLDAPEIARLVEAIERLQIPVYLSGMARGLLGADHPLQLGHRRTAAMREADLIVLAGVPCDFRLGYGRKIPPETPVFSLNRSGRDLRLNRRPSIGIHADPALCLRRLAEEWVGTGHGWGEWRAHLLDRDEERQSEIHEMVEKESRRSEEGVHPITLLRAIDDRLDERSVVVADGGDFVATAAYTVRPRSPLSWLDPGVFGTLGVGGGFALGAGLVRPEGRVWLLWGDGSAAFSLAEFDTFVRLGVPVIAVVGNDASWAQIAREQVKILGAATGTELRRTDYHTVAAGYGGRGLAVRRPDEIEEILDEATRIADQGEPVLINVHLAPSDFREGSLSI